MDETITQSYVVLISEKRHKKVKKIYAQYAKVAEKNGKWRVLLFILHLE